MSSYTLGVDIGTYETKGVLVDGDGTIVAKAARRHDMLVPQPGWAEHRPEEDWWGDFVHVCQTILNQSAVAPRDIVAVACSAIGPCMLPVDANGEPLSNGVLYGVDTRASAEIAELTADIGADVILGRCGNALTSQSVGPKILWLKRNRPEIFARAAKIVTSTSFLVQRLTGACVIDHYTAANFAPFYDVERLDWCFDLSGDVIDRARLPDLHWTDEIVGTVTPAAAAVTGLAPGTPVTTGTIDAAAEALSVGVTRPGDMMMMYGSTIFAIQVVAKRTRDPRLWYAPWLFEGQHAAMAGLATSGTLTHWFRDQFARELDIETAFAVLTKEAEASQPGAKGLILLPYFSGERTPIHDPDAKGVFFGLNLSHERGDMYRALIEGIAFGTRHMIETFADIGAAPVELTAVGGGVQNRLWLQATSDITGLAQVLRQESIGASFGNAMLAAHAAGLKPMAWQDWNPKSDRMMPCPDPAYDKAYSVFRDIYEATRGIMARL